jgi:hypothetical protein
MMTTHDKPSDRVESVVAKLEAWGPLVSTGYEFPAAGRPMYEAAKLLRTLRTRAETAEAECLEQARLLGMSAERELALRAEVERRIHDLYMTGERYHAMIARAEQAEAQLAAMQGVIGG